MDNKQALALVALIANECELAASSLWDQDRVKQFDSFTTKFGVGDVEDTVKTLRVIEEILGRVATKLHNRREKDGKLATNVAEEPS